MTNEIIVRWFDGYLENFHCSEVRFGSDLLFMRLSDNDNRHIPLRGVRWFSLTPESHGKNEEKQFQDDEDGQEGRHGAY